jgi:hypothetical protein
MKRYPVFCHQPETGAYSLMVFSAENEEDRDLRKLAISRTWVALGLQWGACMVFVYRYANRTWAGTIAANTLADAEALLAQFSRTISEV